MRCRKAQKLISVGLDGELDEARARALKRHLAECQQCRAFASDVKDDEQALAQLTAPEPRPGFTARLLVRMPESRPSYVRLREWVGFLRPAPLGVGTAAFCLGIIVVVLANGERSSADAEYNNATVALSGDSLDTLSEVPVDERLLALLSENGELGDGLVTP